MITEKKDFVAMIELAMQLKKIAIKKGRPVTAPCPFCESGKVTVSVAGPKHHARLYCSTPKCAILIE